MALRLQRQQLDVLTPCRPTSINELVNALSSVHVELILIHPFREGNGRIARLLLDLWTTKDGISVLTTISRRLTTTCFEASSFASMLLIG